MLKVKSILIRGTIEGQGIVNFDSNDQKWLWNRQKSVEKCHHNNVNFGKGRYYEEEIECDGIVPLKKVAIISPDCIRHTMYEDNMFIHLPNIMHDDALLLRAVASPAFLERGYLFARDRKTIWKRKSPFVLSYAKATDSSVSALETCSNSQPKSCVEKTEDVSETSFFKREVRGEMKYEFSGGIDVGELGFISVSEIHDRLSFDSDYVSSYSELLSQRLGTEVPESGFYQKEGDLYEVPEQGILLESAQIKYLTEDILQRLARFNLTRTVNGTARVTKLETKIVRDPLVDLYDSPEGWVKIFTSTTGFNSDVLDDFVPIKTYNKVDVTTEAMEKIASYRKKFGYEKVKKTRGKKAQAEVAKES